MARDHLTNTEFFTQLTSLLETVQTKGHGSVSLTQKRMTFDTTSSAPPAASAEKVADDPLWDLHPPDPLPLIIRATDGRSTKKDDWSKKNKDKVTLSTVVQPDDLDAFFARYAEVCKTGMSGLKKRDRSKRKKKGKKEKGAGAEEKKT